MSDYVLDFDLGAADYSAGEYEEFFIDQGSETVIPTGVGATPLESASSPESAIKIYPNTTISFTYKRIGTRPGNHTFDITFFTSSNTGKTFSGESSTTWYAYQNLDAEGSGRYSTRDFVIDSNAKGLYLNQFKFNSTRGDGQSVTRNVYFEAAGEGDVIDPFPDSGGLYGVEIFDAQGNNTLTIGDTVGFISNSMQISLQNGVSSVITMPLAGIKTTDVIAPLITRQSPHTLKCSIPSNGNIRIEYDNVYNNTGYTVYNLIVYNLGD